MPTVVRRLLLRAPLLPLAAVHRQPAALVDDVLGRAALGEIEPTSRAAARYGRRASFRPTPHGLWAGVGVADLGDQTRVDTGAPVARTTVSYARLASLARAVLDDAAVRERVELRVSPSLLRHGDRVMWLSRDGQALEAELDAVLEGVLDGAQDWMSWRGEDDMLLQMLDDGLLLSSLEPPLIGPPPLASLRKALRRAGARDAARGLDEVSASLDAGSVEDARALLATLPGEASEPLHTVLTFPAARATVERAIVERAAALAPLLFRLQTALAAPIAERALDPAVTAAIDAVSELYGAGALDLAAFATGACGVTPSAGDKARPPVVVPPALLTLLIDGMAGNELRLRSDDLDAVLEPGEPPATYELFLMPRIPPAVVGVGGLGTPHKSRQAETECAWLLGLHGPAGATWGRFAHALGAPLIAALDELAAAEPDDRVDVAFAPRADLGDLAAHPPLRRAALALTSWPARNALPAGALELVSDPGALEPLALQSAGRALSPSPLARLRSTTAPAGVYQLLTGWNLTRQHAPWAMTWGPLSALARTPRVLLDGFVIAPASWRIPADLGDVAAWRRREGVPRFVQVGQEDELLCVDLDAEDALRDLAGHARAFEIWPPLDEPTVDRAGRRVELVAAVVHDDAPRPRRTTGAVAREPAPGWRTFKIFGARDRQDRVLGGAIAPAVARLRTPWFFQRYVEGGRHHLRLRVHGETAFAKRLDAALAPAFAAGDVVAVESGAYFAETARFGGARELAAAEAIFASDSRFVLDTLDDDGDLDTLLVTFFDATAAAFGLSPAARLDLAARRRQAEEAPAQEPDPRAADYRVRQRALMAALSTTTPALAAHAARVKAALRALPAAKRAPLLPIILHLAAVRLAGPDRDREAHAYYLWQRARESLGHARR